MFPMFGRHPGLTGVSATPFSPTPKSRDTSAKGDIWLGSRNPCARLPAPLVKALAILQKQTPW